ncbi:ribonuclease H-like domain-containing protein [Tanacetum coccineum]
MIMEQYLTHTNYALWEVIVNGDAPAIASASGGTEGPIPPKTAKQKLARKNELKAKSTLLLAILDEHILKFHGIKDAKTLWEAIKARLGGNKESKKIQKIILKLQFENFVASRSEVLDKTYDSCTNEAVNTAHEVSTANLEQIDTDDLEEMDLKWRVAMLTMRVKRFLKKTRRNLNFNGKENVGIDKTKVECYNCHRRGHFARECKAPRNQGNRNRDASRRVVPVETPTNALVVQDGICGYDWSFQADEGITNIALMAYTSQGSSSLSSSDSLVHTCSKDCLKSYETLQKQYDQQREALKKSNLEIIGYQIGLESLEARIIVQEKNEVVYEEDIAFLNAKDKAGLGYDSQINESEVVHSVFNSRESDVDGSPVNDRFKIGEGFHAVPPPYTRNNMPSRPDLSFAGLDNSVYKTKVSETIASKTSKDNLEKPKTVRPSAPIIEDWDTDSENDSVFRPKSDQTKPNFTKINFVKSNENVKSAIWQVPVNAVKQSSPRAATSIVTARPVNIAATKSKVNDALPKTYSYFKAHSLVRRDFNRKSAAKTNNFNEKVKTTRVNNVTTDGRKAVVSAAVGNGKNAVKSSTCWILRPTGNVIDHTSKDSGSYMLKIFDYVDLQGKLKSIIKRLMVDLLHLEEVLKEVFFFATKDETSGILITFVTSIEKQINHKVKIIRCDNGTKFKNNDMNQFCGMKGIKMEFSIARTPQQNGVAKRKNKTLIKAAKTMLADSLLHITFWAEAVSTAYYVQNRVLVTKPHNKTPYVLLHGRPPNISFMRPFECPVTILNTLDLLGKFDEKADDGFFVGYSINSKAFRVFNVKRNLMKEPANKGDRNFTKKEEESLNKENDQNVQDFRAKLDNFLVQQKEVRRVPFYKKKLYMDYIKLLELGMRLCLPTYLKMENGYRRGTIDKTLFIKKDRGDILFQMSSIRELTFFLGLQVQQKEDGIFISQDKYVADILKKFDFTTVKATSTLIETNKALNKDEEAEYVDVHLYRLMIGSLMYLIASRPDIMFVVCACARFQVTPKTSHLYAVKRIFRYLKGLPKLGLWYPKDSPFDLEAFSDSDFAGASLDRKSTTGGCQFLGKRFISWQCKKQTIVVNSTTEAEYVVAAIYCGQVLWIQNQMLYYGFNFMNTKIYINNESTICIVKNLVFHSKTKHIEIRHHFIRDTYEKKLIQVIKIHTDHNVADLLTKAFDVSRKAKRSTKISQSSGPIHLVTDETVYKEWEDRMERVATTASSLKAEQDSGNINRTQSMATLNESLP